MTDKALELIALGKIKAIIESLGDNSWVGYAFEGCCELAESNIESDLGESWKARCESARNARDTLSNMLKEVKRERDDLKAKAAAIEACKALYERAEQTKGELIDQIDEITRRVKWEMAETQFPDYEWIAKKAAEAARVQGKLEMLNTMSLNLKRAMEVKQ